MYELSAASNVGVRSFGGAARLFFNSCCARLECHGLLGSGGVINWICVRLSECVCVCMTLCQLLCLNGIGTCPVYLFRIVNVYYCILYYMLCF